MAPTRSFSRFQDEATRSLVSIGRDIFTTTNANSPIHIARTPRLAARTSCDHSVHAECLHASLQQCDKNYDDGTCPCCQNMLFAKRPEPENEDPDVTREVAEAIIVADEARIAIAQVREELRLIRRNWILEILEGRFRQINDRAIKLERRQNAKRARARDNAGRNQNDWQMVLRPRRRRS